MSTSEPDRLRQTESESRSLDEPGPSETIEQPAGEAWDDAVCPWSSDTETWQQKGS